MYPQDFYLRETNISIGGSDMEYLVIGEAIEGVKTKDIMENAKAGLEYRRGLREKGKILYFGNFTGRRGGCAIYNVENHMELHELLHNDPMYRFMDFKVIPLTPADKMIELIEKIHKD
jgi:muconolactone D-isomerase